MEVAVVTSLFAEWDVDVDSKSPSRPPRWGGDSAQI